MVKADKAFERPVGHGPAGRPDPLSLQGIDIGPETPADLYRSGNSIYTCVVMSGFSVAC